MSSLEVRRELRRRKILENSASRLKRITNVNDADSPTNEEVVHVSPLRAPTRTSINTNVSSNHTRHTDGTDHNYNDDLITIYQNPRPTVESEVEFASLINQSSQKRMLIIMLMALIVRYVYLLTDQYVGILNSDYMTNYHLNKIFMPFVAYEIVEFVFYRPFIPHGGLLNMLFMLNAGFQAERVRKFVTCCKIAIRILENLMVYFFAFVCLDWLIAFILQNEN